KPDVTFILDIPVEIGMKRAALRRGNGIPDRFEAEGVLFHQQLREAFRQIAANEPQRCVLINADADAGEVATKIWASVQDRLLPKPARTEIVSA
ncbi:MAG: thymidylate kinase, partial [Tardiphaga sp.]